MLRRWLRNHDCALHTAEAVQRLETLTPCIPEEADRPVMPAELAEWISIESEDKPEIADHGWRVDLDDAVGLLVRPDHDDLADLLAGQQGVRSVVQLDREVFAVEAPGMGADGLQAAVMQAVSAANRIAHGGDSPAAIPDSPAATPNDYVAPAVDGATALEGTRQAQPVQPVEPHEDDDLCRLVTGDAVSDGKRIQVWVNQNGILILPAGIIPHGPLDESGNPRFQRATVTPARAVRLAKSHAGRWIPYASLSQLQLRRPGLVRRRWTATVIERGGAVIRLGWRGTRPHALLFWGYVVARRGLGAVDGLP